jgi:TPR repeat protein
MLAYRYASDLYGEPDGRAALHWYQLAADQGSRDAQYELGVLYEKGTLVPEDFPQALYWYRKAANQGHAEAQFCLGCLIESGKWRRSDKDAASKWFKRAAANGYGLARYLLTSTEEESENDVPRRANADGISGWTAAFATEFTERAQSFLEWAENGEPDAKYVCGLMLWTGRGMPQDLAESARWFRSAAEQGHALAQESYGRCFADSRCLTQDLETAHMWMNLAVSRLTGRDRDRAVECLSSIESAMTSQQVKSAQDRAATWGKA